MSVMRMRDIQPMRGDQRRYEHVLEHLYNRWERWDLIIADLPESCHQRARDHRCTSRDLEHPRQARIKDADLLCRALVLADHDEYYAPAYLSSVGSAVRLGQHGRSASGDRELFVGENGVLTIVGTAKGEKDDVISAYGVKPTGWDLPGISARAFVEAALDKLEDLSVFTRDPGPGGGA